MSSQRVRELFAEALERSASERPSYLAAATASDSEDVCDEVLSLLEIHERIGQDQAAFFELGAADASALLGAATDLGTVGPYRLVREIGSGGMGTVYLAERNDGAFEQRVALKVVRYGIDSAEGLRRFLDERQILARLHHPAIAQLFDGGLTPDGRPYFAMEYVDGQPISHYCTERDLPLANRLRLLQQVCGAVQHAHANLTVHRDIKPSNVLVTPNGTVKLVDFGIATLIAAEDAATTATATAHRVMTPQYASPEQFRGERITVTSDVYQLGLLAYELVADRRPYELGTQSPEIASRLVCELTPRAPLATQADSGRPWQRAFRRARNRELATIILKALQKEPSARYASVDQLADDLERFLRGLPIVARAPTLRYRAQRFVSRHAIGATLAGTALLSIVTVTALFTLRVLEEQRATRRAAERAERLQAEGQQVTDFLLDLFDVADPEGPEGSTITARELLDRGASQIGQELDEQPLVKARMLHTIGSIYRRLGLYEDSERLLREGLAIRETATAEPLETMASLNGLATTLVRESRYEEAGTLYQRALAMFEHVRDENTLELGHTLYGIGSLRRRQGQLNEAEAFLLRSKDVLSSNAVDPSALGVVLNTLGLVYADEGRYSDALTLQQQAVDLFASTFGNEDFRIVRPLNSLANLRSRLGNNEEALPLYERAYALSVRHYGAAHELSLSVLGNLGVAQLELGRYEDAAASLERAQTLLEDSLGPEHPSVASVTMNRGNVELERKRYASAESLYRSALRVFQGALGPQHPQVGLALNNVGEAVAGQRGRDAEAVALFGRSLAIFEASLGSEHLYISWPLLNLARIHLRHGELDQASTLLERALTIRRRNLATDSQDLLEAEAEWAALQRERSAVPPAAESL